MILLVNFSLFSLDLVLCFFRYFLFDLWREMLPYIFDEIKGILTNKESIAKKTINFIDLLLAIFCLPFGCFILILLGLICDLIDVNEKKEIYKLNAT